MMSFKTLFYLGSIMVIAQVMLSHAQTEEAEKTGGCRGCGHHHGPKPEQQNAEKQNGVGKEVEKLKITPVDSAEIPQSIDSPKTSTRRNSRSPTNRSRSPTNRSKSIGEVEQPKQEVQKAKGPCKGCHHHHGPTAEKQNGAEKTLQKSPSNRSKSRSPSRSPKPDGRSNSRGSSPKSGSRSNSPSRGGPEPVIVSDTRRARSPVRAR